MAAEKTSTSTGKPQLTYRRGGFSVTYTYHPAGGSSDNSSSPLTDILDRLPNFRPDLSFSVQLETVIQAEQSQKSFWLRQQEAAAAPLGAKGEAQKLIALLGEVRKQQRHPSAAVQAKLLFPSVIYPLAEVARNGGGEEAVSRQRSSALRLIAAERLWSTSGSPL